MNLEKDDYSFQGKRFISIGSRGNNKSEIMDEPSC